MRWRIIAANSVIVVLISVFMYAVLHAQLTRAVADEARIVDQGKQVVHAANAQLQLDALQIERWLSAHATAPNLHDPFTASIKKARYEAATAQCNRLKAEADKDPQLAGLRPAIIAMVDANGISLGRNGSNLLRGDDLGKLHPKLKETIRKGLTGSSVWYLPKQSQQWFVSYAAVRDNDGKILGGIVYGTPLNDERLTRTSEKTSGGRIAIAVKSSKGMTVLAKSKNVDPKLVEKLSAPPFSAAIEKAFDLASPAKLPGKIPGWVVVAHRLYGYGTSAHAVIIAASSDSPIDLSSVLMSVLGMMVLGIILVAIVGWLLGNYISRPVEELEDGLLQILNGQTNLRFEIEHDVLGGLVFRINTLLNQLMNVEEDNTDEEGRPSLAPSADAFQGALEVDERQTGEVEKVPPDVAVALANEPADAYYKRIFREYIEAKRALGDPTDHITEQAFIERIRQRELEQANRTGRPVRFQVRKRDKEVVLIAVQLP